MRRRSLLNTEIESENLHDVNTDIADIYIQANGIEKGFTGWSATDKIKVTAGDYLITRSSGTNTTLSSNFNYAYKNTAGGYNFAYAIGVIHDTILHISKDVEYIRLSDDTNNLKKIEIYKLKS